MVSKITLTTSSTAGAANLKKTKVASNSSALSLAAKKQASLKAAAAVTSKSVVANAGTGKVTPPSAPDVNYKWNLPPHQWSLPVTPAYINNFAEDNSGSNTPGVSNPTAKPGGNDDKYRRGRIWWWYSESDPYVTSHGASASEQLNDRKYGFQFLWNPETWSNSVSLNTSVTPTPMDQWAGAVGAYPANQSVSLSLRLDRTNDFACMRSLYTADYSTGNLTGTAKQELSKMASYYNGGFQASAEDVQNQLLNLMKRGTMADIEYLYRVVNGGGWFNVAGVETSDIGYLPATLIRFDLGPASYVGYINSLAVNHSAFSQDMTPIRTDIDLGINIMASASVANGNTSNVIPTK